MGYTNITRLRVCQSSHTYFKVRPTFNILLLRLSVLPPPHGYIFLLIPKAHHNPFEASSLVTEKTPLPLNLERKHRSVSWWVAEGTSKAILVNYWRYSLKVSDYYCLRLNRPNDVC